VKSLFERKVVLVFGKLTFGNREFAEGEIKHFQSSDKLGTCQKLLNHQNACRTIVFRPKTWSLSNDRFPGKSY
jgi:hypothetical protein